MQYIITQQSNIVLPLRWINVIEAYVKSEVYVQYCMGSNSENKHNVTHWVYNQFVSTVHALLYFIIMHISLLLAICEGELPVTAFVIRSFDVVNLTSLLDK